MLSVVSAISRIPARRSTSHASSSTKGRSVSRFVVRVGWSSTVDSLVEPALLRILTRANQRPEHAGIAESDSAPEAKPGVTRIRGMKRPEHEENPDDEPDYILGSIAHPE